MWAAIANTGYGMRSSHGTAGSRGMCGPAVDVPEPAAVVALLGGLAPRGVGDDVAVLAEQRLDDLEDGRVARPPAGTPRCG